MPTCMHYLMAAAHNLLCQVSLLYNLAFLKSDASFVPEEAASPQILLTSDVGSSTDICTSLENTLVFSVT
jgi:hypothetical protein